MAAALSQAWPRAGAARAESPSYTAYAQGRYLTALKLAEEEAAKGSKEAYTLMGEIYSKGSACAGFQQGRRRLCQGAPISATPMRSSRSGSWSPKAVGVKKDLRIAADLFEKAAQNGNPAAQYNLALIYLHGKGRAADEAKAAEWMQKAAEAGNAQAAIRSRRLLPIRPRRADRQGQGRGMDRSRRRGRPCRTLKWSTA